MDKASSQLRLPGIVFPVGLEPYQASEDGTVEYFIRDSAGRNIATLEWGELGRQDGELLVQLINSTNL